MCRTVSRFLARFHLNIYVFLITLNVIFGTADRVLGGINMWQIFVKPQACMGIGPTTHFELQLQHTQMDEQLICEIAGHRSNAVKNYKEQILSRK